MTTEQAMAIERSIQEGLALHVKVHQKKPRPVVARDLLAALNEGLLGER